VSTYFLKSLAVVLARSDSCHNLILSSRMAFLELADVINETIDDDPAIIFLVVGSNFLDRVFFNL